VRSRLARAQSLILEQYDAPLDLDRLARQACCSWYHFLRVYQQAYGVTPHQDLTRARVQAARRLLEETELPVTDICFAVGFRSSVRSSCGVEATFQDCSRSWFSLTEQR
jgi:transcriptional regulator GlxA family with amidase domain